MPKRETGKIRIIAGRWRGRRLEVADKSGLRPTSDRIRETLFSWLSPLLQGARCLDLYAGTGALGFEAASRGAGAVTLVEKDRELVSKLDQHVISLAAQAVVHTAHADAMTWLHRAQTAYDIVFLDPPFGGDSLDVVPQILETGLWLSAEAAIYLEMPTDRRADQLPANWQVVREKTAGRVRFCLARRSCSA